MGEARVDATWEMDTGVPVVVLATGHVGHGIARSLGRLGVPALLVHADPDSPAGRSRYWTRRHIWDFVQQPAEASIAWLQRLAEHMGTRPILIPTGDVTALLLADHAPDLERHFLFPTQPPGLARALSDKRAMYALCRTHGIPTAETCFPQNEDDLTTFAQTLTFPVVLKGVDTDRVRRLFGTGTVICDDMATLRTWYSRMRATGITELMLQECIPGTARDVWMFNGYFDEESRCLFGITGRKIRQYPAYVGLTSLGVCQRNDQVASQAVAMMRAVGYRGILDIGFKHDARTGQYKLLDVNPRIGTTFRLFVDSIGMDVIQALHLDLTGRPVPAGTTREGRKWLAENFDLVSTVQYLRHGDLRPGEWLRSFHGVQEASWFARDDPLPFLAMVYSGPRWLLNRQTQQGRAQER